MDGKGTATITSFIALTIACWFLVTCKSTGLDLLRSLSSIKFLPAANELLPTLMFDTNTKSLAYECFFIAIKLPATLNLTSGILLAIMSPHISCALQEYSTPTTIFNDSPKQEAFNNLAKLPPPEPAKTCYQEPTSINITFSFSSPPNPPIIHDKISHHNPPPTKKIACTPNI